MKKIWGFFTVLLLICTAGFFLLFYRSEPDEKDGYRIAAVMPASTGHFWEGVWRGVETIADALSLRLSEYSYDTNVSEEVMTNNLEKAILSQVDGILLCSNQYSSEKSQELLRLARDEGIKVVLCDSDAGPELRDIFIGVDNTQAGQLGAQKLLEQSGFDRILLIQQSRDYVSLPTMKRQTSFKEALASSDKADKVVEFQLSENDDTYYQTVQQLLMTDGSGNAVVCFNASSTLLAAQTVKRLNLEEEVLLLGFCETAEAFQYVESGVIDILITQDTEGLGRMGVEKLEELLSGQTPDLDTYYVDMKIVTKENIDR